MFTTLSSMGPIGFGFAPGTGSMYTGHKKRRGVDRKGRGVKGRMQKIMGKSCVGAAADSSLIEGLCLGARPYWQQKHTQVSVEK